MKASCPRCGRGNTIDPELGDFPMRCHKCGALLRRASREESGEPLPAAESHRIEQGALAGLLISQSEPEGTGTENSGHAAILRPESRAEIARAAARQNALRKAQLRASMQSYTALNWAGLCLVALLIVGVLVLKANSILSNPSPVRADTLRVSAP